MRLGAGVGAFGGLDRADEDVGGAELLELFEGGLFGAFADGDHKDDGRHAKDDPQRREQAAELVQPEVLQPEAERLIEKV